MGAQPRRARPRLPEHGDRRAPSALLGAAVAALVWANSPWSDSYESFWSTKLSIRVGERRHLAWTCAHWVNEGLMTFFFLVVGLEAKRELDMGELRERRRLAPRRWRPRRRHAVPVLIFLAFNAGGSGAHGWGAAMSTDTAFALGVLALVAPGATRLRVRLLTIAVVDDLVALLVIATVYTDRSCFRCGRGRPVRRAARPALRAGRMARAGRPRSLGVGIWVALYESGIDPLIAGLAVGLATSAYPARAHRPRARDGADALLPRAAHARARALGPARRRVGDLRQRAAAVPAPPLDELRDRAAVRARQRGHPHRRRAARRRRHVARSRSGSCSATWSASRSASSARPGSRRGRGSAGAPRR